MAKFSTFYLFNCRERNDWISLEGGFTRKRSFFETGERKFDTHFLVVMMKQVSHIFHATGKRGEKSPIW